MTQSSALDISKTQELYRYAREAHGAEYRRFDAAEEKVGRYLTLLALVLGVATLKIDGLAAAVTAPTTLPAQAFIAASIGFAIAGGITLCLLLKALAVGTLKGPPVDKAIVDHFAAHPYNTVLDSLAHRTLEAVGSDRALVERKFRWIDRAHRCLWVSLALAFTWVPRRGDPSRRGRSDRPTRVSETSGRSAGSRDTQNSLPPGSRPMRPFALRY